MAHRWTQEQVDYLVQNYGTLGPVGCSEHLGLSYSKVADKAAREGVRAKTIVRLKRRRELRVRFEEKYIPEPNSGCWLWVGAIIPQGYGRIWDGQTIKMATHVSLGLDGRPVPDGMFACHRCDNGFCVNPEHLFIGTASDNVRDCQTKGRWKGPPPTPKGRGKKAFCHKGHPLSGTNLAVNRNGTSRCKECAKLYQRSLRTARRLQKEAANGAS